MNGRARMSMSGQGSRAPPSHHNHQQSYRSNDQNGNYNDYDYDDRDQYDDRDRSPGGGQARERFDGRGGQQAGSRELAREPSPLPERGILVRALFDFKSSDGKGISFRIGDTIEILGQLESGWWDGVFNNQRGSVHNQPSSPNPPSSPLLAAVRPNPTGVTRVGHVTLS